MTRQEQIRKGLIDLAKSYGPDHTLIAEVVECGEDTCTVNYDDLTIEGIRLRPVLDGTQSLTLYPKAGSLVLCIRIEDEQEWQVISYTEIDKYRLKVGDMLFEMEGGKFRISKGAETLGKCIDDLILQIQAIYAPKNTVAITAIQNRFKSFLHAT